MQLGQLSHGYLTSVAFRFCFSPPLLLAACLRSRPVLFRRASCCSLSLAGKCARCFFRAAMSKANSVDVSSDLTDSWLHLYPGAVCHLCLTCHLAAVFQADVRQIEQPHPTGAEQRNKAANMFPDLFQHELFSKRVFKHVFFGVWPSRGFFFSGGGGGLSVLVCFGFAWACQDVSAALVGVWRLREDSPVLKQT